MLIRQLLNVKLQCGQFASLLWASKQQEQYGNYMGKEYVQGKENMDLLVLHNIGMGESIC